MYINHIKNVCDCKFYLTNYFVLDPMKRILARNILEWKMIISKTKKDLPGEC